MEGRRNESREQGSRDVPRTWNIVERQVPLAFYDLRLLMIDNDHVGTIGAENDQRRDFLKLIKNIEEKMKSN